MADIIDELNRLIQTVIRLRRCLVEKRDARSELGKALTISGRPKKSKAPWPCSSPWTAPPKAAQPNGQLLDTLDGRFVSQIVQKGDYVTGAEAWLVHSVNVGGLATGRLYHMVIPRPGSNSCTVRDLYTTNNDHIFNLSVAVNATQAFVTASRAIRSQPTSGNVANVMFRGPNNSASGWTFDVVSTSASQFTNCDPFSGCPWGFYSATQIDPSDNGRAWGFNELITGPAATNWTTQAAVVSGATGVASLATSHDFDGDVLSDILWRNTSGDLALWMMSGTAIKYTAPLGNVGLSWTAARGSRQGCRICRIFSIAEIQAGRRNHLCCNFNGFGLNADGSTAFDSIQTWTLDNPEMPTCA